MSGTIGQRLQRLEKSLAEERNRVASLKIVYFAVALDGTTFAQVRAADMRTWQIWRVPIPAGAYVIERDDPRWDYDDLRRLPADGLLRLYDAQIKIPCPDADRRGIREEFIRLRTLPQEEILRRHAAMIVEAQEAMRQERDRLRAETGWPASNKEATTR